MNKYWEYLCVKEFASKGKMRAITLIKLLGLSCVLSPKSIVISLYSKAYNYVPSFRNKAFKTSPWSKCFADLKP